ncbi:hypothetical protein PG994_003755 [Apiospora phragmitis]|uniref:Uncharacterized protein n=1 Tax=Apiospora phragmitis TaxID=2905665 RepID=A0ABR1VZ45_9PEZI
MAPVTRRRAKAAQEYADSCQTSPDCSILSPGNETNTTIDVPSIAARLETKESPVEETPTKTTSKGKKKATPKLEKLAVRVHNEDTEDGSHHVSVEAHTVDAEPEKHDATSVADSQEHEQVSDDAVEEQGSSTPFTPSAMLSKQLEEEASQQLKRDRKDLSSAKEAPSPAPKAKGSHVVFGDDDELDKHAATAAEKEAANVKEDANEDEEESDDDEAPEAVSTSVATKAAKKSEREAAEAAEKHAADLKRKRQEKDKMMKEQAEKRKRTQLSRREQRGAEDSDEEDLEAMKAARRSSAQQKLDRHNLPDELPAEFLTDSDSEDEGKRKPKKIKFEDAVQSLKKEGGRPEDEVVGSTVYRVLADQGDKSQAPRMHHNARRMKEQLLHRGRAPAPTGEEQRIPEKQEVISM